jgi:CBS domain-containing protein
MVRVKNVLRGLAVKDAYSRQSLTVTPDTTIREAAQMTLNSFQADFPVCDGEQLLGILTHSGLVRALDRRGPDALVEDVMIQGVEPVTRSDPLIQVQNRMLEENIDALPVVEDDRFLGIITTRDINEIYRMISLRSDLLEEEVSTREISLEG